MQTALVLGTLEILPAQVPHCAVIPPQKEGYDHIKGPGADHLTPNGCGVGDVEWGHHVEGGRLRCVAWAGALCDIDRNHNHASDDAQKDEDVATHLDKSQEDRSVQADRFYQLGLPRVDDRFEPGKETLTHWRRGMFEVCMLDFGGIHERVTGTDQGEDEGEEDGDTNRSAQ